jgi:hypothetical protein
MLGVVIGATLQFIFTQRTSREQQRMQQTATAYAAFLKALAAVAAAQSYGDSEMEKDAQRDLLDARGRIAIYGSDSVIHALAAFSRAGGTIGTLKQKKALVLIVQAMRRHTRSLPVSDDDISRLILYEDLTMQAES